MTELKPMLCKNCGEVDVIKNGNNYIVHCSECGAEVLSEKEEEAINLWNDFQRVLRCRDCDLPPSIATKPWTRYTKWEVFCWKCRNKTSADTRKEAVDLWNEEQSCKN